MPLEDGGIPYGALDHEKPGYYRSEFYELQEKFNKIKTYTQHKYPCKVFKEMKKHPGCIVADDHKCTCGLDQLLGYKYRGQNR